MSAHANAGARMLVVVRGASLRAAKRAPPFAKKKARAGATRRPRTTIESGASPADPMHYRSGSTCTLTQSVSQVEARITQTRSRAHCRSQ
eukprot:7390959-Prymnesium_polylepis.1